MQEPDPAVPERQRDVQRTLGRCLQRLQHYEFVIKRLAAHHDIAGPASELQAIHARRVEGFGTKTLGQVVREVSSSYLTSSTADESEDDLESPPGYNPTKIWFRSRCYTSLSREECKQARQDLEELVRLRNELVHHFLERFNVWTIEGCDAADVYLDESYATIDGHYQTLRDWTDGMDAARTSLSQFLLSPEGQRAFLHSLQPQPASIDWAHTKIESLLLAAEETLNEHGWTLLAKAIDAMRRIDPEETPKRYGCSSWRQVIHESRLFEIRKTRTPDREEVQVWYRTIDFDRASWNRKKLANQSAPSRIIT
ncbi:OST-HTH/LOTUS domain-containing protein [Nitrogeniibacter aestuarii]|uniref:OST-HTH/LOTUS domain-containing protein n=1 Tax=Nitrogeniibacter aestuarii TaxID=2815343 RepID=UPI001E4742B8|nr:OST-HTH/LOTUS domain-containing protein [Nitrogeniibacter aestuarii]